MPLLGRRLLNSQEEDFDRCKDYYLNIKIDQSLFVSQHESILKHVHAISYTMSFLTQKLSDSSEWSLPYLNQLKTDTIQLIPSVAFGNRRNLHLYTRASIEDFLRYIYYFDHKIEHLLLQSEPTKYQNFDFLIKWVKNYPSLKPYKNSINVACSVLSSRYAELSRTIHGTTLEDLELLDNLKAIYHTLPNPSEEKQIIKSTFGSIFYILSIFHKNKYNTFSFDERMIICQHLSSREKQILSGTEST